MAHEISEADWKVFRRLHPIALERFCDSVLAAIGQLMSDSEKSAHERYLGVCKLVKQRDNELEEAFDDLRRSTAVRQLILMRSRGFVREDEIARFSPELQAVLQLFLGD